MAEFASMREAASEIRAKSNNPQSNYPPFPLNVLKARRVHQT
jgi:hypothetical protein